MFAKSAFVVFIQLLRVKWTTPGSVNNGLKANGGHYCFFPVLYYIAAVLIVVVVVVVVLLFLVNNKMLFYLFR